METNSLLIGITGGFGSGKSTASSLFELKGFMKITLSSFLEEEAKKRSFKKITREILQDIGNEWRKNFGHGILAGKAVDYIKRDPSAGSGQAKIKKAVIDGIRNTGEVERLRKEKNFILLGFVADKKNRFERLKNLKIDLKDLRILKEEKNLHAKSLENLTEEIWDWGRNTQGFRFWLVRKKLILL